MSSYEMIEKEEAGNVTATYVRDDAGFPAGVFIVDCEYVGESSDLGSSGPPQIEILILNKNTGVGVGDSTATPTTALLLSVIHSSTGRIATILFAHRLGTALEPECKMYRFAADIFNDTAMVLDCLSPAFPKPIRVAVLSFSSCLSALCGVCAGSSKASLSAHFARKGNLGEVNAKDSSQETVISLLGMLAGSVVISYITSPLATWGTLILLLTIHLATNYAAVRAVIMHCLNRQRANILFSNMFQHGLVLSPRDVSQRERVFERGGVLRWSDDKVLGRCSIGVPLQRLLNRLGTPHKQTGSLTLKSMEISDLLDVFANEAYILLPASTVEEGLIVLKRTCEPIDQIKAWAHALLLAKRREGLEAAGLGRKRDDASHGPAMEGLISELRESLKEVQAMFARYGDEMRDKGWDVGVAAMETQAGVRLQID
ncbi:hypothetical protein PTNB73_09454 [Pyrenophora teres f. teres]|nr:hypothetical protein HRS9139_10278 [Pyrenophora teres f. teres]KAE8835044.1 hypothetical protein PTNB85_06377 [Pyrenophora teres f. teres]KAE8843480.1 hypothetical protein HRS9122_04583 [Pyrenophora teres f. teres]KAE8856732.1 hypothetical protein PTNB73_09454 [Pyrenophora teres f. teres]KAE8861333.1 hypothetical protein PTNB29_06428 [Pyrenophora teres f. teres]